MPRGRVPRDIVPRAKTARRAPATAGPRAVAVTDWTGAAATPQADDRLAAYYDLQHGFTPGATSWPDVDWFRSVASGTGGPILELGCGSGRIAVALAGDGHAVTGLDRSPAMLRRARDRARAAGVEVALVAGDLRDFRLVAGPASGPTPAAAAVRRFALVIVPFNTFLMVPAEDRPACLARIRAHLAPGGHLAIDVFQPDPERIAGVAGGILDEGTGRDERTGESVTFLTSTHATVDRAVQTLRIDVVGPDGLVHRLERVLTLHFLYRREAELLLDRAGFAILSLHGDHHGAPADERSPRLLVVARRRERGAERDRRR